MHRSRAEGRVFLQVDGMHCATCEGFLESVAKDCEGVVDAAASYVTETVRITYDPDCVSKETLCVTLSTLGYSATLHAGGNDDAPTVIGQSRRSDEPNEEELTWCWDSVTLLASFLGRLCSSRMWFSSIRRSSRHSLAMGRSICTRVRPDSVVQIAC